MVNGHSVGKVSRRGFKAILASICLLTLVGSAGWTRAGDADQAACDYSGSLKDPSARAKFLAMKAEMELIARIRMESGNAGADSDPSTGNGRERILDPISRECISCHARKGASAVEEITSAPHGSPLAGMTAISATHAIGTDYVKASLTRWNLHKPDELPKTMILVDGRIACITCHNPLNPQRYSLAVDNQGSDLCFACHRL